MDLNRKNMQRIALLITFAVLLLLGVEHITSVLHVLYGGVQLVAPFLLGACIAFILNVPMTWIENGLFAQHLQQTRLQKSKRVISILLTFLMIIGIFAISIGIVAPQIGRSVAVLMGKMPAFWEAMQGRMVQLQTQFPFLAGQFSQLDIRWEQIDWQKLGSTALQFLQSGAVGDMLGSTFSVASSIIGGIVNFFLGLFFAVYILAQKETLGQQAEKILYAALPKKAVESILEVAALTQKTFSNFISGQCTEAVILGLMFFIAMSILRFPYAVLVGVLIALTALIPIFGAFIGCGVGVFLILVENPVQALWFLVLFLLLQQVEGNFIYPHVVGNSVGLPSIWVLVAVTLGASTFGVVGMLVFIPLFSILYTLIRAAVYQQLRRKGISLAAWQEATDESPHAEQTSSEGEDAR